MISEFDQSIATIQAMEIQKRNGFAMTDQDNKDLEKALSYINNYFK